MCSKVEGSPSLPDQCRSDPKQDELSLQLPLALCRLDASLGEGGGSLLQFTVSGITATAAAYMGLFFLVFLVSVSHVFPYDCPRKFAWIYSLERNDFVV